MAEQKKCKFIKSNGKQCQAWAMEDSDFCFTHNPKMEKERKEAVIRGGKSPKRNYIPLEPIEVKDNKDVVKLIVQTINEVRRGVIDIRVANCIFYGSGQLIKALEIANLEERVSKIEEILNQKNYRN